MTVVEGTQQSVAREGGSVQVDVEGVELSVLLSVDLAAQLENRLSRGDVELTDAVNRAVALWLYIEGERDRGGSVAVMNAGGASGVVREVILPYR